MVTNPLSEKELLDGRLVGSIWEPQLPPIVSCSGSGIFQLCPDLGTTSTIPLQGWLEVSFLSVLLVTGPCSWDSSGCQIFSLLLCPLTILSSSEELGYLSSPLDLLFRRTFWKSLASISFTGVSSVLGLLLVLLRQILRFPMLFSGQVVFLFTSLFLIFHINPVNIFTNCLVGIEFEVA